MVSVRFCAWLRPREDGGRVGTGGGSIDRARSTAEGVEGLREEVFPGISRTELEDDAAHADAEGRAILSSLRRMVSTRTSAHSVPFRPIRRSASTSV